MKKTTLYTIVAMAFAIGLASNATAQKDTTEVKMGNKKLLIIENIDDNERAQSDLEAGKRAFEDLLSAAAEKNAELKLEILELNKEIASSSQDSTQQKLKAKVAEKEKKIAENEKKIEAFESGIAGIETDLDKLSDQLDDIETDDIDMEFNSCSKKKSFNGHLAGFQIGLTNLLLNSKDIGTPEAMPFLELNPEKSIGYQFNLEKNIPLIDNRMGFVTGVGIEWNSFSLAKNIDLAINQEGKLIGNEVATTDRAYEKNNLNMAYLTIPFIFEVQPWGKKSFHISAGITGGIRLWSKQKQTYYTNDHKNKYKKKDAFNLNPFRYGATAKIGYNKLSLYANYNISDLFKKGTTTDLVQPFTTGVAFSF